jgi:hypothetical protein
MNLESKQAIKEAERILDRLGDEGVNGSVLIRVANGKPQAVEYNGIVKISVESNTCNTQKPDI